MAQIADTVFDNGLSAITANVDRLYICSADPVLDFTNASSTYKLGNKLSWSVASGNPQNGATNGRRVLTPAITDGSVTGSGTATHWALCSGSVVYASGSLSASQAVTSGNTFTLAAFSVTIADAT